MENRNKIGSYQLTSDINSTDVLIVADAHKTYQVPFGVIQDKVLNAINGISGELYGAVGKASIEFQMMIDTQQNQILDLSSDLNYLSSELYYDINTLVHPATTSSASEGGCGIVKLMSESDKTQISKLSQNVNNNIYSLSSEFGNDASMVIIPKEDMAVLSGIQEQAEYLEQFTSYYSNYGSDIISALYQDLSSNLYRLSSQVIEISNSSNAATLENRLSTSELTIQPMKDQKNHIFIDYTPIDQNIARINSRLTDGAVILQTLSSKAEDVLKKLEGMSTTVINNDYTTLTADYTTIKNDLTSYTPEFDTLTLKNSDSITAGTSYTKTFSFTRSGTIIGINDITFNPSTLKLNYYYLNGQTQLGINFTNSSTKNVTALTATVKVVKIPKSI